MGIVPTSMYISSNCIFGDQKNDNWLFLQNEGVHYKLDFGQDSI